MSHYDAASVQQVYLTAELKTALEKHSATTGLKKSEIVRQALVAWFKVQRTRPAPPA